MKLYLLPILVLLFASDVYSQEILEPFLDNSIFQPNTLKKMRYNYISENDSRVQKANKVCSDYINSIFRGSCPYTLIRVDPVCYSYREFEKVRRPDTNYTKIPISYFDYKPEITNSSGITTRLEVILDSNYQIVQLSSFLQEEKALELCSFMTWEKAIEIMKSSDSEFVQIAKYSNFRYDYYKKDKYV